MTQADNVDEAYTLQADAGDESRIETLKEATRSGHESVDISLYGVSHALKNDQMPYLIGFMSSAGYGLTNVDYSEKVLTFTTLA